MMLKNHYEYTFDLTIANCQYLAPLNACSGAMPRCNQLNYNRFFYSNSFTRFVIRIMYNCYFNLLIILIISEANKLIICTN